MRIPILVLALAFCTGFTACDVSSDDVWHAKQRSKKDFGIEEALTFKSNGQIFVLPGMHLVALSHDNDYPQPYGYWRCVLRPFHAGETPEMYVMYIQDERSGGIDRRWTIHEQVKQ